MKFRYVTHLSWLILAGFIAVGCPALAQTRLGLHVTQEELNIWRQRAQNGPYKTAGDVSTNSPGDWTRIVNNRNAFASNPSNGRWKPPVTENNCVPANTSTYGWPEGNTNEGGVAGDWATKIRDAAFHNLVMGVTTDRAAIKQELLWVASQSFTQWGNPNGIWCFGKIWDSAPAVGVAAALQKLLYAYDYLGRNAFTQSERDTLDRWFFDAADFWRRDMDFAQDEKFVDRWNGNYTLTGTCDSPVDPYVGGPNIQSYARFYNNRRGGILAFTAQAGIYLQQAGRNYTNGRYGTQAQLVQSGKLYVQEFVRFSLFPQGVVGDFERRFDDGGSGKQVGWAYAGASIGSTVIIADAIARAGDTSLYTYSTSAGGCGTAGTINDGGSRNGQNRDLKFAVESYLKYITDGYARYWPSNDSPTDANRIDGRYPRNGSSWHGVHDTHLSLVNNYFQDTFIKQAYTRTHANSVAYPADPQGGPPPWTGAQGVFPGILFMFGGMEGKVSPYSATSTPPNAPGNLTITTTTVP
jgi:hypothetical protein